MSYLEDILMIVGAVAVSAFLGFAVFRFINAYDKILEIHEKICEADDDEDQAEDK